MKSRATRRFWELFGALPVEVRKQAYKAYGLFEGNPFHSSLHFEEVDRSAGLWSARVNDNYRVPGYRQDGEIRWF